MYVPLHKLKCQCLDWSGLKTFFNGLDWLRKYLLGLITTGNGLEGFQEFTGEFLIISRKLKTLLSFTVLYSSFYLAFLCINNINCTLSAYSSFLQNQIIFFLVKNLGNKENHLNQVFAIICNFYYGKIGLSLGYNL